MERKLPEYSVLMSVYYKENAEWFETAIRSMLNQTVKTDDFVLVCDGSLTEELDGVIEKYKNDLNVIRLEKNSGLGNALNEGLKHCKHELVARMDSDDISMSERCEKQLNCFAGNERLDIVSGTVLEFVDSPEDVTGSRVLPDEQEELCRFSHKRNPFNHPAVMFRKSAVENAGGYDETYSLFEDYYLWIRMLQGGSEGMNIKEPVLYMRTPRDLYKRRGGWAYAKRMMKFHYWVHESGWTTWGEFCTGAIPHAVVCVLPNRVRKMVYGKMHFATKT